MIFKDFVACFVFLGNALVVSSVISPLRDRLRQTSYLRGMQSCETPYIRHGAVMRRQRGRSIEYTCDATYSLVGDRFAVCVSGKWDLPIPLCAKAGCPMPQVADHGIIIPGDRLFSALLFCMPGFEIAGARETFCDGDTWDRQLGSCRETRVGPQLSCDFESPTLCDWANDDSHDINWIRSSGVDSQTNPRFDHTIGKPLEGHFMTVEGLRSIRRGNARIMSPIYNATYGGACFNFHFNIFRGSMAFLVIYQKPVRLTVEHIKADADSYRVFSMTRNQGTGWRQVSVQLFPITEPFQIVLEVRQTATSNDLGIDDVEIDLSCIQTESTSFGTTEDEDTEDQMTVDQSPKIASSSSVARTTAKTSVTTESTGSTGTTDKVEIPVSVPNSEKINGVVTVTEPSSYVAPTVIGASSLITVILVFVAIALMCRRKKTKLKNKDSPYKDIVYDRRRRSNREKHEGDDSDVRILTSRMDDEELDFRLMSPEDMTDL
ncbi:hypothetical protein DMENIID0001_163240 [Sergentomyia squamirostris]